MWLWQAVLQTARSAQVRTDKTMCLSAVVPLTAFTHRVADAQSAMDAMTEQQDAKQDLQSGAHN